MNRNQALDSAKAAINRAPKSYGNPAEHFERVARLWNAHIRGIGLHLDGGLKTEDVAIMLGLVKIARLEHDPQHADSWCDLAGYAACGAEVSEPAVTIKTGEMNVSPWWRARDFDPRPLHARWTSAPLYTDDMEVTEPVRWKMRFGFKVGETVNSVGSAPGSLPGTVAGFTDKAVLVRWNHWRSTDAPQAQSPHNLCRGA